jgi:hypothetical protein
MKAIVPCIAAAMSILFAQPAVRCAARRSPTESVAVGSHGFDFLFGRWKIENRRLRHPLTGSSEWYEFQSTSTEQPLLGGQGSLEQYDAAETPAGPIHAIAVRLYNSKSHQWSIYWSKAGTGEFCVPTVGGFKGGVGLFFDRETYEGRPILVRFTWTHRGSSSCRFEQAFSSDNGKTWEANWIMNFRRIATARFQP